MNSCAKKDIYVSLFFDSTTDIKMSNNNKYRRIPHHKYYVCTVLLGAIFPFQYCHDFDSTPHSPKMYAQCFEQPILIFSIFFENTNYEYILFAHNIMHQSLVQLNA